jgi:hypothetical protein
MHLRYQKIIEVKVRLLVRELVMLLRIIVAGITVQVRFRLVRYSRISRVIRLIKILLLIKLTKYFNNRH